MKSSLKLNNNFQAEKGSISIVVSGIIFFIFFFVFAIASIFLAVSTQIQSQNVSNLSALSAAREFQIKGKPCLVAEKVAKLNGAQMISCEQIGNDFKVRVKKENKFGFIATAKAGETEENCLPTN